MKLHLPLPLRKCILLLSVAAAAAPTVWAGVMHEDIAQRTYADFGQNRGRFKVTGVSSMLQAIRDKDGGIVIPDTNPNTEDYKISLDQGMINFSGVLDYGQSMQCQGAAAAFGSNYLVTVAHNPTFSAMFGGYQVGTENTIKYSIVNSSEKDHGSSADWALYRQNKIFTDVVGAQNYSGVTSESEDLDGNGEPDIKDQLLGELMYRAGAGAMWYWMHDGSNIVSGDPYTYIIGGVSTIKQVAITDEGFIFAAWNMDNKEGGVSPANPLPTTAGGGDSGTPVYIYNKATGQYEYFFSERATNFTTYNVGHGSIDFANETLDMHSRVVDMSKTNTAYLNAVSGGSGTITVGDTEIEHLAVNSGSHTWKNLAAEKDKDNWFAYDNGYQNGISGLGSTHNLIFNGAGSSTVHQIILNATVDTGVGYTEFNKGKFIIKNAENGNYMLNSAGYVINDDAEVHVQLTNDANYMREWRKNGAGDLYIEGSGNNNILLAVGGSGTTYLDRDGGYAAYNVMAAGGATVVIRDIKQIARDFTFGLNGGTLDMNGNRMDWYTKNTDIAADGFSINALTDDAIITNTSGTATLVYKQSGESTWKGSLKDTSTGAIQIVADAGAGSVWTMNSIGTDLTNHAGSSFTINSGTVVLAGTNTEHGPGSVQYSNDVWSSTEDWHYADAKMDVTVNTGSTFQLGSHARLKGDITVNGGTYVMNEGVRHRMEYIEGGAFKEDTYQWSEYYGHHGDTILNNGTLKVQFDASTTANNTYAGNITGNGTVTVDTGSGSLTLTGTNSFTGARSVENGTLIVANAAAAGSEKWLVKDKGIFAAKGADGSTALQYVSTDSTGVLALTQDQTSQIDLTQHNSLILGALEGQTINYGSKGTTEQLRTNANNEWRLGGGGGELVVNYLLTGNNKLILGNGHTKGTVTLTNTGNDFTGGIDFVSSGVTLNYTDPAAIDKVSLNLTYGNRATMAPMLNNITAGSDGILLQNDADADMDLSQHSKLFVGSEGNLNYTGNITVANGQNYRFSASNGTFTVNSALQGNHNIIVDAQGYTGGTVKLTNISPITGSVTVTGADASSGVAAGNITLRIDQDNLLDNATGVYLKKGGTLHIGDSTQHIGHLALEAGSSLIGNRLESATDPKASELHVTIDSIDDIKGSLNVDTIHRYGNSTLELNNGIYNKSNLQYRQLVVEEGDVKVTADYAQIGNINIRDNKFDINGHYLYTGSITAEDGAVIDASKAGSEIGAYTYVTATSGTATLSCGSNDMVFRSIIGAMEGATLRLTGTGNWDFSYTGYNEGGGTLRIEDADKVKFTYGDLPSSNKSYDGSSPYTVGVGVKGTLELAESVTAIQSAAKCHVQELNFDTIKLNGQNLNLEETTNQAVWRINNLQATENSTLTWTASHTTTSSYLVPGAGEYWDTVTETNSSRLILQGENSFTGNVIARRTANGAAYNSYVELAHDKALQNGTLELQGYNGSNMALAVNTDNAQIKGLNGNEHTLAYGGESYRVNQDAAPTSTRNSTLHITGDGTYEFKGAVDGLSIAMDGSGSQKFTGSNVSVANIHANAGRLEFSANTVVTDTIYLGKGGILKMGESYNLNEGTTLAIIGNRGAFESTLVLNGGTLAFDSAALNAGAAQFNGTMQFAEGHNTQTISIINPTELILGHTYALLSNDWTGKTATLDTTTSDYLQGSFTADGTGLKLTVTLANGFAEWKGSNYDVFDAGNTVLFRDTVAAKNLNFTAAATAAGLRFVNDETYTFSGSDVTLSGALQIDSGKLVLNNKLTAASYQAAGEHLEIAENGTLHLSQKLNNTTDIIAKVDNITGTGTLQVHLDTANGYNNKLDITDSFSGTTHVLEGNLSLDGSSFGNTLRLANGVNAQISSGTTINGNIVLDGTSGIHQNSGNNLTINGSVSGSENSTWNRHGGGTLTINGTVNLGTFDINADNTTNNFNGKTSVGTVMIDQNRTNMTFAAETTLGTVTIGQHNNTLNLNGETTIGTLNVGREGNSTDKLTVNVNADTSADSVNIIYKDAVLSGSGKLSVGHFNMGTVKSVSIDGLHIAETSAQTRTWDNHTVLLKNGAVFDTRDSYYNHSSGTLTIGGSDADGAMYVKGICLMPNDIAGATSILNVSEGAHLIISGEKSGTTASDFVLAVGGEKSQLTSGSNKININGTLTSNASMTLYYKSADVTVGDAGRLNLLSGLELKGTASNEWVNGGVKGNLNVLSGGQLYAAGGTNRSEFVVSFAADTTLGAIGEADSTVTFSNNMSWGTNGTDGTITIDTAATTADENLLLTRSEDKGVTMDMTGNISLKGNVSLDVIGSGTLKHKSVFNTAAAIRVQEGASLAAESDVNTAVELNKSSLELNNASLKGDKAALSVTESGSIRATGGSNTVAANTVLGDGATITYDVAEGASLSSTGQLTARGARGNLVKLGAGTAAINNTANVIANIRAEAGELQVFGDTVYDLQDLQAATSAKLGFYIGAVGDAAKEASVRVNGTATFGAGSTLNANLTMTTGSTLEVAEGGLAMGSTLTLQEGITLGETTLERIHSLSVGESTTLFSGVDGLTLGNKEYASITAEDSILAAPYFSNLESNYAITYTGTNDGSLNITMLAMSVPEPTTATLSLLALAALAARRRRK